MGGEALVYDTKNTGGKDRRRYRVHCARDTLANIG
jgi:hypothetical protein